VKNPDCIEEFGLHLRKLREKSDLSQQDLADKTEISKKTIQRIETSKVNPTLDTLKSLAIGLKISLSELMDF
jgi:transcriptional regulator with XRE-family HTH domain